MTRKPTSEELYSQAQSALKARDYDRAAELLARVLAADENYRDASRLLAQAIRLKRRKWYNHPVLWGPLAGIAVIGLIVWLAAALSRSGLFTAPPPAPSSTTFPKITRSPSPTPTPVPLAWKRVSIGQEFERDTVFAIATDPRDPDVIYVGMKNAGVYKSIDGGLSWKPSHQGLNNTSVQALLIDPKNPQTIYAATLGGAYKSIDGAEHWTWIAAATDLLMDPADSSHLYGHNDVSVAETVNGGDTWRPIPAAASSLGAVQYWAIDPGDGAALLASNKLSEFAQGIYLSVDSGRTWMMVLETGNPNFVAVGRDSQGKRILYAMGVNLEISYDDGASWHTKNLLCNNIIVPTASPATIFCPLYAQNPVDITRSDDGGHSWRILPGRHIDAQFVAADNLGGSTRVIAGGHGVEISYDDGSSWLQRNDGLPAARADLSLDPHNWNNSYISTYFDRWDGRCSLYRSADNSQTWIRIAEAGTPSWCGPAFGGDDSLYRAQTGNLLRSTDLGTSWFSIRSPSSDTFWVGANPYIAGLVYAAENTPNTYSDTSYYSTDYGNSWQPAFNSVCLYGARFIFPGPESQFAYAAACGGAARSMDEGQSWQACAGFRAATGDTALAIDPRNDQRIIAASLGQGILVSDDACLHWNESNTGLGTDFINSVAIDPNQPDIVYAGTQAGAFISFDGGTHWQEINEGLLGATIVYSIAINPQSNVYAATPYGIFKLERK